MTTLEKTSDTIIDLIVINQDRHEGYKTALEESKEGDLRILFNTYSNQSHEFATELRQFVPQGQEQPKRDETKTTGKLFRLWMDLKASVTSNDRKAILASCEFGEDAAKKHYEEALSHIQDLPAQVQYVVRKQSAELQKAHDRIKALRDSNI
jgi:uncharacterized protein (TIGR02284 family)